MKKLAFLVLAIAATQTLHAQSDPISQSKQIAFRQWVLGNNTTGGYKSLVKNTTTGDMETGPISGDTTQTVIGTNKTRFGAATTAPFILTGSGTPLYRIKAPVGSMYIRTNGVTDSVLYIKMVGATDSAGWYPLKH